jgi:hypothetical protein
MSQDAHVQPKQAEYMLSEKNQKESHKNTQKVQDIMKKNPVILRTMKISVQMNKQQSTNANTEMTAMLTNSKYFRAAII